MYIQQNNEVKNNNVTLTIETITTSLLWPYSEALRTPLVANASCFFSVIHSGVIFF